MELQDFCETRPGAGQLNVNPFDRLTYVEQEYRATRRALAHLEQSTASDPAMLAGSGIESRHIRRALGRCEQTYVIRAFAEFEAILREFWQGVLRRPTQPDMSVLVTRIAARRNVPHDDGARLHEVREYRNAVVHAGVTTTTLTWQQCRSRMAKFLSYLPYSWLYTQ